MTPGILVHLFVDIDGLMLRVTMSRDDALPVLLVGRDTFRLQDILQAKHVFSVAHVAFGVLAGRSSRITPLPKVCILVR